MDEDRYIIVAKGLELSLKDCIENKYPVSMVCEDIDSFETLLNECMNVKTLLNEKESEIKRLNHIITVLTEDDARLRANLEKEDNNQIPTIAFEIVDCFIRGIESEKGIAENNKEFQERMDCALDYMKLLKEELKDPSDFLRFQEAVEEGICGDVNGSVRFKKYMYNPKSNIGDRRWKK